MGLTVPAEGNGLTQRVQEDFAIGTGELLQNLEAVALAMSRMCGFAGSGLGVYFRCHE